MTNKLALARAAVAAKIAYWEACNALEKVTAANGEEWDDRTNDAVIEHIEGLAMADSAEDLSDADLQGLVDIASRK